MCQSLGVLFGIDIIVEPYLVTVTNRTKASCLRHLGCELIYFLAGEMDYRHSDRSYRLQSGDSLLFDLRGFHGPGQILKNPVTYLSLVIFERTPRHR